VPPGLGLLAELLPAQGQGGMGGEVIVQGIGPLAAAPTTRKAARPVLEPLQGGEGRTHRGRVIAAAGQQGEGVDIRLVLLRLAEAVAHQQPQQQSRQPGLSPVAPHRKRSRKRV